MAVIKVQILGVKYFVYKKICSEFFFLKNKRQISNTVNEIDFKYILSFLTNKNNNKEVSR